MKSHARVVVIGGGVVGCSVLFHLARAGWTDIVLVERHELTSGSTWHAAGGMHTINGDPNVAKLQKYTISLYKEIEELSGQATGVHLTGGVFLAATEARMDWLRNMVAKGRYLGIELEEISPREAAALMPLIDPGQFVGAIHNKEDGHLDPSGVTHAYAKAARKLGAAIERFTKVEDIVRRPDGMWRVITNKGEVVAEHVVNAGGLWAREVGRMVGLELPVLAMEHMYLITEDMPEVAAWNKKTCTEIMHAVDFDGELYLRQERGGMLMGTYEKAGKPWSERVTHGTSATNCLSPISTASRRRWKWGSGISRRSRTPASSRSSTARSPSRPMAIRSSVRCVDCRASGQPAASWRGSARAAVSAWPSRTG